MKVVQGTNPWLVPREQNYKNVTQTFMGSGLFISQVCDSILETPAWSYTLDWALENKAPNGVHILTFVDHFHVVQEFNLHPCCNTGLIESYKLTGSEFPHV